MNIFATDPCPVQSALWLDDIRGNKMILESAQLLSASIRFLSDSPPPVYKTTHSGHPCTIWTRKSQSNFLWLVNHMQALLDKCPTHKSGSLLPIFQSFGEDASNFFRTELTPFANCTDYKDNPDVHSAYRQQMCDKWKSDVIVVTWTKGERPPWYN